MPIRQVILQRPVYRNLIDVAACLLIAGVAVVVPSLFFGDFFFIDDVQNATLPFLREMGRMWWNGYLPILTTKTMFGGNMFLEMVYMPFLPQSILVSLVAARTDSYIIPSMFMAWMNAALVALGAYWLARAYTISRRNALLYAFLMATSPMFLYLYQASWWNYAAGFGWMMVALAALIRFRKSMDLPTYLIAVLGATCLFTTSASQIQLIYGLYSIVVLIVDYKAHRSFARLAKIGAIGAIALLVAAIPLMSEYMLASEWISRYTGFHNRGNFLVPSLNDILNVFNPFYHSFIPFFRGYRQIPVSWGYIGIIFLIPICFMQIPRERTPEYWMLVAFMAISLLLSFSSTQIGPTRWPFRYLPVLGATLGLWLTWLLDKGIQKFSKTRIGVFLFLVFFSCWLQFFSNEWGHFQTIHILIFVSIFLAFSGLIFSRTWHAYRNSQAIPTSSLAFLSLMIWIATLLYVPTLAGVLPHRIMPGLLDNTSENSGYVLNLCPGYVPGDEAGYAYRDIETLSSAQFLLFNVPAVNGYSPVGHKGFVEMFPHLSAHGIFIPIMTINNITQPSEIDRNVFEHQLLNIGRIWLCPQILSDTVRINIEASGLHIARDDASSRILIKPREAIKPRGTLSYQWGTGEIIYAGSKGMSEEWFDVPMSHDGRTLIFSRIFWPGYKAEINGVTYEATAYRNLLVRVDLPPGVSGKLKLSYTPVSWVFTRWSIAIGIFIFITVAFWIRPRRAAIA